MKSIYQTFDFTGRPIDFIKSAQIMFDEASANEKVLFEQTYIDEWFDILPPQYELNAETVVGKSNIRFMASVIGNSAMTPLRPTDGFEVWKGEIPRMGHRFLDTADDLRKLRALFDNSRIREDAKVKQLEKSFITNLQDAYLGCKDSVVSIVLQALSNNGVSTFNSLNNADGRQYKVDFDLPKANQLKAPMAFTDANKDKIDILEYFQSIIDQFDGKGFDFGEMLLAPEMLSYILRTTKIRQVVHGTEKKDKIVSVAELNEVFGEYGIPPVRKIRKKNAIAKDGRRYLIDHWNKDFICFKPAGKLGKIQPAFEDNEIIEEPDVTYLNADGGIRVAKWRVGESTGQTAGEYTQASWRAVPMIDNIDQVVCIKARY